jgi:hypothetical protein
LKLGVQVLINKEKILRIIIEIPNIGVGIRIFKGTPPF